MEIIGDGEDALTLWSMKNKLDIIFQQLDDNSDISKCKVFFRPSFGRRGGDKSSQFGEFDFIILSEEYIYLGESKWNRSSENKDGVLELRSEQKLRHDIFKFYVEEWLKKDYSCWPQFLQDAKYLMKEKVSNKPLAPASSLLSSNLKTILDIVKNHFVSTPKIKNVLLYLHNDTSVVLPEIVSDGFNLVLIDYSTDSIDNFIKIVI